MANADAISADQQVARIFEWRRGFNTIHLIDVGVRLGLFKALAETPGATAEEVAATPEAACALRVGMVQDRVRHGAAGRR